MLPNHKEIKTICSEISPSISKQLYRKEVLLEEKATGKRISAFVVDHAFEDQKGFIVKINRNKVKGMIKKYNMGPAEFQPDLYVEADLRNIHHGSKFYLVHDNVLVENNPVSFTPVSFEDIKEKQFILALSKNNPLKVCALMGIDHILSKTPNSYKYRPISNWNNVYDVSKHNSEHLMFYVVNNGNYEVCQKIYKQWKENINVLHQYYEVFSAIFNLDNDTVYKIIFNQLSYPSSYLSFMNLYNSHIKAINNIYFKQESDTEFKSVQNNFKHIFQLSLG